MIVSASRRTDLPAFYSKWFQNRLRAGFCLVKNPFNPAQVRRVDLDPGQVTAIVFWTRDPGPLVPWLDELDSRGYRYYFLYTITGMPKVFEPNAPDPDAARRTFRALSGRLGPERVIWRFDPILISDLTPEAERIETFEQIAAGLAGATRRVIFSFADLYRKVAANLARLERDTGVRCRDIKNEPENLIRLARRLASIAQAYGLEPAACCEVPELGQCGIRPSRCIDDDLLNHAFGLNLHLPKDKSQRLGCGCVTSVDVGAYDTCGHGCVYCYATKNSETARRNMERHDAEAPDML